MKLKYKLLKQSIVVLISTIAVTACAGFVYAYFYNLINNTPIENGAVETAVVIIEDNSVIYQSEDFSNVAVKEMLMNISVNKDEFDYKNKKYKISMEDSEKYRIIRLNPIIKLGDYYKSLVLFVVIVFLITFVIASIIAQRRNTKHIIIPIMNLKRQTENLRIGELNTAITDEGYGEVSELSNAVEQLRLKLKDSIYYQQKYDDNRKFLISSISHDLKTPVTSIRGYIDGVLDGVADTDEKKHEYLTKAVAKTKLINTMIEDLLLYSKLDLNQMPFNIEKCDIKNYIESAVDDNLVEFENNKKKIIMDCKFNDAQFVNIDCEKFKRVVQNILDNAKKNIEANTGQLTIKLREKNSSIILEFRDNGKGISEEDLPHIFDRFYRADSSRSIEGSSGLGLAIAKQIVEGLGGRIWAISRIRDGASIIISLRKG